MASDNYMFQHIMVAIIRLCSYKGKLNTIASSIWFDVDLQFHKGIFLPQPFTFAVQGNINEMATQTILQPAALSKI